MTTNPKTERSIGVLLPRDLAAGDLLRFARLADALALHELWVVEDLGYRGGIAQASAVLASTARIRVGIGILPAGARNVVFTAMELNTLAELFPGRVHIGIGHGMPAWMRQAGAWPASPLGLLREQLVALRALLDGHSTSAAGRYVQLTDVALERPAHCAPPILAGVRGPQSLALAGEVADGTVLAEPAAPEYIAAARRQIGDVPGHRIVAYNVASIGEDVAAARRSARRALTHIGDADWAPHIAPMSFAADLAVLRRRCSSRAQFAAELPDEWVDQLAIVGDPGAARARIRQMHDAGASSVILIPVGEDPLTALQAFGGAVGEGT